MSTPQHIKGTGLGVVKPRPSVCITRNLTGGIESNVTLVPERFLRGVIPSSLLSRFPFSSQQEF